MKRENTILIICLILAVLLLNACSSTSAQPSAPLKSEAPYNNETQKTAYPAVGQTTPTPTSESSSAYPVPVQIKIYGPDETPIVPETAPQPKSGMASISGTLFSYTTRITIPGTRFYLVNVTQDKKVPPLFVGPEPSKGDIIGQTDSNGELAIDNIPPGAYYIAVWDNYSWEVVVDPSKDPASARLIEVKEGQQALLGLVQLSWP